jgi:hypothetical protein
MVKRHEWGSDGFNILQTVALDYRLFCSSFLVWLMHGTLVVRLLHYSSK